MSNTFPAGFKSPGHSLCDCGVFILSLPGVIDLNHNQCLRCQVTSQNPTVNTERHKSPISHCSWTTVPASSLLTLPYKLELRGFPLPLLLKGLFPGCPHFPFLDALLPVMMVYFWPAVAFFFFFLKGFPAYFLISSGFWETSKSWWFLSFLFFAPLSISEYRVPWRCTNQAKWVPLLVGSFPLLRGSCMPSGMSSSRLAITNLALHYTMSSHGYTRCFESFTVWHLVHHMDQRQQKLR